MVTTARRPVGSIRHGFLCWFVAPLLAIQTGFGERVVKNALGIAQRAGAMVGAGTLLMWLISGVPTVGHGRAVYGMAVIGVCLIARGAAFGALWLLGIGAWLFVAAVALDLVRRPSPARG
ncbi:hypothetical protein AMK27_39345 [Streptomyces sp. CB02009]|nr:hypothetical protein AMK27_39345 [Streptomyces sp. CB02009]